MFDMVQVLKEIQICLVKIWMSMFWVSDVLSNELWAECVYSEITKHQFRLVIQFGCSIHHLFSVVKLDRLEAATYAIRTCSMISQVCMFSRWFVKVRLFSCIDKMRIRSSEQFIPMQQVSDMQLLKDLLMHWEPIHPGPAELMHEFI